MFKKTKYSSERIYKFLMNDIPIDSKILWAYGHTFYRLVDIMRAQRGWTDDWKPSFKYLCFYFSNFLNEWNRKKKTKIPHFPLCKDKENRNQTIFVSQGAQKISLPHPSQKTTTVKQILRFVKHDALAAWKLSICDIVAFEWSSVYRIYEQHEHLYVQQFLRDGKAR